ncbi:outer membrane lipoprotein chaperone LolA [Thiohalobacter thiocyanaticus]|nr:outer membrane lipoprotein chaperone LolA [Thiohalobacter thiocyanaticus]
MFSTAQAEPPAVFTAFFDGLRTFRADFTQEVLDRHGDRVQRGAGEVFIQRPGRFRWNYDEPYTQVILGDGRTLWTYDADLEQATRKPQAEVLMGTPAVLLSSVEDPAEVFVIAAVGGEGETEWAELVPRDADSQFEAIHLGFVDGMLQRMILHDSFGQRTDIRFTNAQRNVELDPGLFRFDPPPGTDVLGGED